MVSEVRAPPPAPPPRASRPAFASSTPDRPAAYHRHPALLLLLFSDRALASCVLLLSCPAGRFVHTRNISGLTDKCAQRMSQVLISGGDGDAGPVPGIPSEGNAAASPTRDPFGPGGAASAGGMPLASHLKEVGHRATPPSTGQARRMNGTILHGAGAPAIAGGISASQMPLGLGSDSLQPPRSPLLGGGGAQTPAVAPGHYIGGAPGMGGFGGGGMSSLGGGMGASGAMSPIQRSIFRGGHDPTGAGGRLSPGAQSPISSPQIRGHTAAGGAQSASPPWRPPPARPLFLLASRLVPPCSPLTLLRCTHCCVVLTAPLVFARRPHHHRRRLTVRRRLARLWLAPLRRRGLGLPGSRLRKLAAAPGQNRRGLNQPNAAAQPDGLRRLR